MKKTYIAPQMEVTQVGMVQMLAASIVSVGGDSDLNIGEGDIPTSADVKGSIFEESPWD